MKATLLILSLLLLAGCATPSHERVTSAGTDKRQDQELAIADCMKQKGFKYVPYLPQPRVDDIRRRAAQGDYTALRRIREKYGFGIFARYVHTTDPSAEGVETPDSNPNHELRKALSAAQRRTYDVAAERCFVNAVGQVLGVPARSRADYYAQVESNRQRKVDEVLDSDPELIVQAALFADCLNRIGQPVTENNPSSLATHGIRAWTAKLEEVEARYADPATVGEVPPIPPEVARRHFEREINTAFQDLECGKNFYAVFNPKANRLTIQANAEYGLGAEQ
ncbi:hypothetical protein [Nonomuraea soli]|uniref:Uncharacterized protein n=1 Tax=Nonomuraea soli TaxID=1032476 RepID=A0A7W0CR34_9ACTN|nr:hypothetical protein [Nonomuraea soli]MBA2895625.1 hypothetical protein [Nonomuraea soli]